MVTSYNEDNSTYTIAALDNIIEATITNSGNVASKWVDDTLLNNMGSHHDLIVGIDVEWCPNSMYGTRGQNPVALLQLCVGRRCLIFQLLYCDFIPEKLIGFLKDDRFRFVGVGIRDDAVKLKHGHGIEMTNIVDLRFLAAECMGRREIKQWGLKNLAREIMGVQMEKPQSVVLSNWGNCNLSLKQIEYAAIDAFVSFEVGRRLYAIEHK